MVKEESKLLLLFFLAVVFISPPQLILCSNTIDAERKRIFAKAKMCLYQNITIKMHIVPKMQRTETQENELSILRFLLFYFNYIAFGFD